MFSKAISCIRGSAVLRWSIIVTFWLILLGIALFPFLFQGRMFIDADTTLQFYPFYYFYKQAVTEGASFLWNPTIFLGFPTYLSQTGGFLDPLNWALFHVPVDAISIYHARLIIDFLLALYLSYLVGRELGRTHLASLLIGLGYLVAFNWRYLSNVLIVNGLFLMPLLAYSGIRMYRATRESERWRWAVIAGLGIGWSFLAGNAQFTVQATFLFGILFISAFFFVKPSRSLTDYVRYAAYGIAVLVCAVLVALPQILPSLKFTEFTVRSDGIDYKDAIHKVTEPGDVILFAFPDYLYFPYVSGGRKPLYIGALLFLLALVGMRQLFLLKQKGNDSRTTYLKIFLGLFLFSFIASLKWSPIFYFMLKLPVFELFRFPYRWMYLGIWFLCVLGAYGFDVITSHARDLRSTWLVRVVAMVYGTILAFILALNILSANVWRGLLVVPQLVFEHTLHGIGPFTKDIEHYRTAFIVGVDAWQSFVSLAEIRFLVPFSLLVASLGILSAVIYGRLSITLFRYVAFAISVVTFVLTFVVQWSYSVPRSLMNEHAQLLDRSIQAADFALYRTFPFMLSDSISQYMPPTYQLSREQVVAIAEMQFVTGWPNLNVYDQRIMSVDGYDVFVPVDLMQSLGLMGSTHGGLEKTMTLPSQEKVQRLVGHLDVIGMLSGKYIVSGVPLTSQSLILRATTSASHLGGVIHVYENMNALPRWYLAPAVVSYPHTGLTSIIEDTSAREFSKRTYLDCDSCETQRKPASSDRVVLTANTLAQYEFNVEVSQPRWMIFNESNLPGWEVRIDGELANITRANGMVMATLVPAGTHAVVWEYRGILGEATLFEKLGIFK